MIQVSDFELNSIILQRKYIFKFKLQNFHQKLLKFWLIRKTRVQFCTGILFTADNNNNKIFLNLILHFREVRFFVFSKIFRKNMPEIFEILHNWGIVLTKKFSKKLLEKYKPKSVFDFSFKTFKKIFSSFLTE